MMATESGDVWLVGKRFATYHLMSMDTGRVVQSVRTKQDMVTAGIGKWCLAKFVAVYVNPRRQLMLQAGRASVPLDDEETRVRYRRMLWGFLSELSTWHPRQEAIVVRDFTARFGVQSRVNPLYDGIDELIDDFLEGVERLAVDTHWRDNFKSSRDLDADPLRDSGPGI